MTDDNKNSNLIIFGLGIAAMFFAYLIYIKSKETTIQPTQCPAPVPCPSPILYPAPTPCPSLQPTDSVQLYQISEQLKLQNSQIQTIQEQQAQQMQNIDQIESTKCSNVVSMGNNYHPNYPKSLRTPKSMTNVGRENDEYIASNIFGMK